MFGKNIILYHFIAYLEVEIRTDLVNKRIDLLRELVHFITTSTRTRSLDKIRMDCHLVNCSISDIIGSICDYWRSV